MGRADGLPGRLPFIHRCGVHRLVMTEVTVAPWPNDGQSADDRERGRTTWPPSRLDRRSPAAWEMPGGTGRSPIDATDRRLAADAWTSRDPPRRGVRLHGPTPKNSESRSQRPAASGCASGLLDDQGVGNMFRATSMSQREREPRELIGAGGRAISLLTETSGFASPPRGGFALNRFSSQHLSDDRAVQLSPSRAIGHLFYFGVRRRNRRRSPARRVLPGGRVAPIADSAFKRWAYMDR